MSQFDEHLVQRARKGDKTAFGQLVEQHHPSALRVAMRLVNDSDMARQLVQEALLQAYLSLDQLKKNTAFKSWLYGIVLNLCRQHLRQNRQWRERSDWIRDTYDPCPDPGTVFEARDLHQQVLKAIDDLPPQTRRATLSFYYQHMSLKEVAALLDVSIGTVKQHLHRARTRLKEPLRPLYREYFATPKWEKSMITLHIAAIVHHPNARADVILSDETGQHNLSLSVDATSAQALILAVSNRPAPGLHILTQRLIDTLGATLESVTLKQLPENIPYAELTFKQNTRIKSLNAHPGEALALAASTGAPITAQPEILEISNRANDALALSQPAVSVPLTDDSIKGKIVGKNGRNIITYEILTGVKLIVNATPQTVHIVCSDSQKREIAKRALSELISLHRINPNRVAKAVANAKKTLISDATQPIDDVKLFFTLPEGRPPEVITVSNEQVKKRFIGSQGRNALAFEAATGVQAFIADALPKKIAIWSSDTDKLEVARLALERIVAKETINPDIITEIVSSCKAQHYLRA
ncbi:MAG: sigma-70 family RNA polymerase sigma factor [Gemmatimonadetes bacterium]|nr:sigma-70 family RNA polymerase sigma factor [Gemmatimonadota bacterium]MYF72504.1 sigma-70 family RNA polymerase sigma factor [Gemmatimonadota bacterium]MYK50173.1 sigma-70 family RNA polymerase sigma factor [Gemmatimonadota bacterium]